MSEDDRRFHFHVSRRRRCRRRRRSNSVDDDDVAGGGGGCQLDRPWLAGRKDVGVGERLIGMIVDLETRFDSNAAHLHVADLDNQA